MRRYILVLILSVLSLAGMAVTKGDGDAVSMVSYEQGWLDSEGTLSLRNNTKEMVHNVSFRIEYYDMKGNQLDYTDYFEEVEIAPGMSKKVDIPAYEHDRKYSYYTSEAVPSEPHKFKIKYIFGSYNDESGKTDEAYVDSLAYDNEDNADGSAEVETIGGWTIFAICMVLLFGIFISVGLYVLVAVMANHRNRNVVIWLLLSFVATPLLIIVILLLIGDDNDHRERY